MTSPLWPRSQPTYRDFYNACPTFAWDDVEYVRDPDDKWPRVDPRAHPFVEAEGILTDIEISPQDSPFIHGSHDLDMTMTLDPRYGWLSINSSGLTGQVIETESGNFWRIARPEVGDHITVGGRWIFDCGHDPKTEIHPTPLFESDRLGYRPLFPGGPLQHVRLVRVWMNSDPGAFHYTFGGAFSFAVQLPKVDDGAIPFLRVLKSTTWETALVPGFGGAMEIPRLPSDVSAVLVGDKVQISVTPPTDTGIFYYELMLGYLASPSLPLPSVGGPGIYTVTLDAIDVVHEGGDFVSTVVSTVTLGSAMSGNWYVDAHVNGEWRKIFENDSVDDDDPPTPLGIAIPVVDRDLIIGVTGYTDVDPKSGALTSGIWRLGTLRSQLGRQHKVCNSRGRDPSTDSDPDCTRWDDSDWVLYYTVTEGADIPTILSLDEYNTFWKQRLHEESGSHPTQIPINVPLPGSPAMDTHASYLMEQGLERGDMRILGTDIDRYTVLPDDFADIAWAVAPDALAVVVEAHGVSVDVLPVPLQEMFGDVAYDVVVRSATGSAGDQPYTLQMLTTYRELPPDWGTAYDLVQRTTGRSAPGHTASGSPNAYKLPSWHGGRLVDLVTPAPGTVESAGARSLTMDWAWQHMRGEAHWYEIVIPPVTSRPSDWPPCPYDVDGALVIACMSPAGTNMHSHLHVLETGDEADDLLTLTNLNTNFPDGRIHVRVTSTGTRKRCVYRLTANWSDAVYLSPTGCAARKAADWQAHLEYTPWPWPLQSPALGSLIPGSIDPPGDPYTNWGPATVGGVTWLNQVDWSLNGGWLGVPGPAIGDAIDIVISGAQQMPIRVRLFDKDHVLLGESVPLTEGVAQHIMFPAGLEPHARLTVSGLAANTSYVLQLVPAFDANEQRMATYTLGLSKLTEGP